MFTGMQQLHGYGSTLYNMYDTFMVSTQQLKEGVIIIQADNNSNYASIAASKKSNNQLEIINGTSSWNAFAKVRITDIKGIKF